MGEFWEVEGAAFVGADESYKRPRTGISVRERNREGEGGLK